MCVCVRVCVCVCPSFSFSFSSSFSRKTNLTCILGCVLGQSDFERHFCEYLSAYHNAKPPLRHLVADVGQFNFSSARVALIPSVPGTGCAYFSSQLKTLLEPLFNARTPLGREALQLRPHEAEAFAPHTDDAELLPRLVGPGPVL